MTVCVGNYLSGSPPTPFDAQTALITNMFDPHDTCNVCMTGQGVREDHSDPVRAIHLTKWLVKASYTDENEEISLVIKKNGSLTDKKNALSAPDRKILPESIFPFLVGTHRYQDDLRSWRWRTRSPERRRSGSATCFERVDQARRTTNARQTTLPVC